MSGTFKKNKKNLPYNSYVLKMEIMKMMQLTLDTMHKPSKKLTTQYTPTNIILDLAVLNRFGKESITFVIKPSTATN